MDDFMFFGFAGEIQSDELTQDGSDKDWQEYNTWIEDQERERQGSTGILDVDVSDEVDPSGGYDDSDDIYEQSYERDYPSLYEQDGFWDE